MGRARNHHRAAAVADRFSDVLGSRRGGSLPHGPFGSDDWVLDGAFDGTELTGRRLATRFSRPTPTHGGATVLYLDGVPVAYIASENVYVAHDSNAPDDELSDLVDALERRPQLEGSSVGHTRSNDVEFYARFAHPPSATTKG